MAKPTKRRASALTLSLRAGLVDLAPALAVGLAAAALLWTGAGGYWDSYDYARQIVTGDLSGGLLLGRVGFVASGYSAWRVLALLGVPVELAPSLLTMLVLFSGVASAAALTGLARQLGVAAPAWCAVFWLGSPVVASLNGALMSEMPAMAVSLAGLYAVARGLRSDRLALVRWGMTATVCAVLFRETALPWAGAGLIFVFALRGRGDRARFARAAAWGAVWGLAVAAVGIWAAKPTWLDDLRQWADGMHTSQGAFRETAPRQLALFGAYSLAAAGAALPFAIWGFLRRAQTGFRGASGLASVAAVGGALWLAHAAYPDLAYGPRFLVVALPGLALFAGDVPALVQARSWPVVAAAMALAGTLAGAVVTTSNWRAAAEFGHALPEVLHGVPPGVLLTGWHCPALRYHTATGALSDEWEGLCPGWIWTEASAAERVERALNDDVPVYFVRGPVGWPSPRFASAEVEVIAWAERGWHFGSTPIPTLQRIERTRFAPDRH